MWAALLGYEQEVSLWQDRASIRRQCMNELLWDEDRQLFCDRDTRQDAFVPLVSAASLYPLFTGVATPEQAEATAQALSVLEFDHGLACCENRSGLLDLMWDYPHGWAPLHYVAIRGLLAYGMRTEALRLADKYAATVAANFVATGTLWEKYNMVTGEISITKESDTPPMMGWTAGVFLYCCSLLEETL